jgi:multisubunit Na+/H+ antiporter MnhE subunit
MTSLLTLILGAGGSLLKMVLILVLLALRVLLAGLIVGTCVVLVLFQMLGDKDYRKNLFVPASDKQKLLGGNGS